MTDKPIDFELAQVERGLSMAGLTKEDYRIITMRDFGPESWRLVDMLENPTESVYVDGHGFYESMAIQIKRSLERAYELGAGMYVSIPPKRDTPSDKPEPQQEKGPSL